MNYDERHRCPEGFFMVEAFMNDMGHLIIMGEPSEDDPGHNCDEMGCGSFDHVAARAQIDDPRQIDEAMRRAKFLDKLELKREIARLEKHPSMTALLDPFQRVIRQRIVELSQKLEAMEAQAA